MNPSLIFQTGLLYEELKEAFLHNKYALVLTKDFKKIIWASPNAAAIKGDSVFEAINAATNLQYEDISQIEDSLKNNSLCIVKWGDKQLKLKTFVDFSDVSLTDNVFNKESIKIKEAILLIEQSTITETSHNLLIGLETLNCACAIIKADGTMVSSLFYKDKNLYRNTNIGSSDENVNFISDLFLKLKNIIFAMYNPIASKALDFINNKDKDFYKFSPGTIRYKTIFYKDLYFLLTIGSFYDTKMQGFFLITLEQTIKELEINKNDEINEDEETFNKIAEFLKANCQL